VHIGRLRVKLGMGGRRAPQIISVRGFGYKIVSGSNDSGGGTTHGPPGQEADLRTPVSSDGLIS
jgi:hypothetical protein